MNDKNKPKLNNQANPNVEGSFDVLETKMDSYFKTLKKEERNLDLSGLDNKLALLLEKKGDVKLAKKIHKSEAPKKATNTKRNKGFGFWFGFVVSTFGVYFILLAGVMLYLDYNTTGETTNDIVTLRETLKTPEITLKPTEVTTEGYIATNSQLIFKLPAEVEGSISDYIEITPKVDVTTEIQKSDDGSYIVAVVPNKELTPDTNYNITLSSDTTFKDGSKLNNAIKWSLPVEPRLEVLSLRPKDQSTDIAINSAIEMEFNYEIIMSEDISSYFTVSPEVDGSFFVEGRKVTFKPDQLLKSATQYTVTLKSGLPISSSLKLKENVSTIFTTESAKQIKAGNRSFVAFRETTMRHLVPSSNSSINLNEPILVTNATGKTKVAIYKYQSEDSLSKATNPKFSKEQFKLIGETELEGERPVYKNSLKEGLYLLVVTTANSTSEISKYISVSEIKVIADQSQFGTQAWVVDASTGKSLDGVNVNQYDTDGNFISTVKSSAGGLFKLDAKAGVVVASKESSLYMLNLKEALVDSDSIYLAKPSEADLTLDKTNYLPGDQVTIKAKVNNPHSLPLATDSLTVKVFYYDETAKLLDSHESELELLNQSTVWDTSVEGILQSRINSESKATLVVAEIYSYNLLLDTAYAPIDTPVEKYIYSVVAGKNIYTKGESVTTLISGSKEGGEGLKGKELSIEVRRSVLYANDEIQTLDNINNPDLLRDQALVLNQKITLDNEGLNRYQFTPLFNYNNDVIKEVYTLTVFDGNTEVASTIFDVLQSEYYIAFEGAYSEAGAEVVFENILNFKLLGLTSSSMSTLKQKFDIEMCNKFTEVCSKFSSSSDATGHFTFNAEGLEEGIYVATIGLGSYERTIEVVIGIADGFGAGGGGYVSIDTALDLPTAYVDYSYLLDTFIASTGYYTHQAEALVVEVDNGLVVSKSVSALDGELSFELSQNYDENTSKLFIYLPLVENGEYRWVLIQG